ncbi:MAG: hypothetical protein CMJ26_04795 [Phycisphaerae bacterium]|nr:hypothetical protein [Phycisphaerae bacterium]
MRIFTHTLIIGTSLALTACGNDKAQDATTPEKTSVTAPAKTPKPVPIDNGHGHSHGNQPTISMALSLSGVTLDINAQGTLAPNAEYHVDIGLIAGAPGAVIRLWIGDASGKGSMKTKADSHGDHYHAHVLAPKEINDKTAMWFEVQGVSGDRETGQIALQ